MLDALVQLGKANVTANVTFALKMGPVDISQNEQELTGKASKIDR